MEPTPAFFLGVCVSSLIWTVAFLVDSMIVQRASNKARKAESSQRKPETPITSPEHLERLLEENGFTVDSEGRIESSHGLTIGYFEIIYANFDSIESALGYLDGEQKRALRNKQAQSYIFNSNNTPQP